MCVYINIYMYTYIYIYIHTNICTYTYGFTAPFTLLLFGHETRFGQAEVSCMCVYICIYICMYIHIYIYMYMYVYTSIYTNIHTYIHGCTHHLHSSSSDTKRNSGTGLRRSIGCLIFIDHFPQDSPVISGALKITCNSEILWSCHLVGGGGVHLKF